MKRAKATANKQRLFDLRLTVHELTHVRDLLSVLLPPTGTHTISEALAAVNDKTFIETKLWQKVASLCKEADIATAEDAPDYVVVPIAPPTLGVLPVQSDGTVDESSGLFERLYGENSTNVEKKDAPND